MREVAKICTPADVSRAATSLEAVDFRTHQLIRLADARDYLPPNWKGKKIDKSGPFRWAAKGLRGQKLAYVQIGRVRYTSLEALADFFNRLTHGSLPQQLSAARRDEIEAAHRTAQCRTAPVLSTRSSVK